MMMYLLLLLSLAGAIMKNILPKTSGKAFAQIGNLMTVNIIAGILGMLLFAAGGLQISYIFNPQLLGMGILYGILTVAMQSFYMMAVEKGSVSVCSLIYASSFMIPTIFSVIVYDENCTFLKGLGIMCMLISLILVSMKDARIAGAQRQSLIYAAVSMLCAGGVGILQKVFAHIYQGRGRSEYLFIAFSCMLIMASLVKLINGKKSNTYIENKNRFLMAALGIAACVVLVNKLNIILIATLPGLLFFPVYNAGTVIGSAVGSKIVFHENPSKIQWCGILLGTVSIVLVVL